MSKLNVNPFDTKDLITQTSTLNNAMRKEAQIARIALIQGMMSTLCSGSAGDFVMLSNGGKTVFFKSKTMSEESFVSSLVQLGANAGLNANDVLETYDNDAIAMALCNLIQKETLNGLMERTPEEAMAIVQKIEEYTQKFSVEARQANIQPGVVTAVKQQIGSDLETVKLAAKERASEEKEKER